jgi:hypothetical protein
VRGGLLDSHRAGHRPGAGGSPGVRSVGGHSSGLVTWRDPYQSGVSLRLRRATRNGRAARPLPSAIFARTDVTGFERLEYELTSDAIELGLDAALPAVFELNCTIAEFGRGERSHNIDFVLIA